MPQTVSLLFLLLILWPAAGHATVYEIFATGCPGRMPSRTLTGFKLHQYDGILIALHGVAGCTLIKISGNQGPVFSSPVRIAGVDFENDVALLSSAELSNSSITGYEISRVQIVPFMALQVEGYPLGTSSNTTTVQVRKEGVVMLRKLLPRGEIDDGVAGPHSPATTIPVISIQGPILPGHSGAPVFDSVGRVVAIANGGLMGGAAQISWAVPVEEIRLTPPNNHDLEVLGKLEIPVLFNLADESRGGGIATPTGERILAAVNKDSAIELRRALSLPDVTQHDKNSALFQAVRQAQDLLPILVQAGARPHKSLICAAPSMTSDEIRIIGTFPGLNANYACGTTPPLLLLVGFGVRGGAQLQKLQELLRLPGVDVNVKDANGNTALHLAAKDDSTLALDM